MNKQLLISIIDEYRLLVNERYQYDYLAKRYDLDDAVTKEQTEKVRAFFLHYVYPNATQRETLDKAFENLDKHIKNPMHLLKLAGDASALIFQFGFQFPKALKAGFKILQSFNTASKLEKEMALKANEMNLKAPVSSEMVKELISKLSKQHLEDFIDTFEDLLASLTDTELLKKTIVILNGLQNKMKERKDFFSSDEVKALQIGIQILEEGYLLFSTMSLKEKKIMTELILMNEKDFVNTVHS